jgi:hypothetical protein
VAFRDGPIAGYRYLDDDHAFPPLPVPWKNLLSVARHRTRVRALWHALLTLLFGFPPPTAHWVDELDLVAPAPAARTSPHLTRAP